MDEFKHQAVLMDEVCQALQVQANGFYVDGTFGRGGHAEKVLQQLNKDGYLLAIDKDPQAVAVAKKRFKDYDNFAIEQGSFAMLEQFCRQYQIAGQVDGILLDLGVSSPQLDDADRGFSFLRDGPLDMRMDTSQGETAAEWIQRVELTDLIRVFKEYGEERYAKRIATAVVEQRQQHAVLTTKQLADIIAAAHPAWEKHKHPATRCFQAIRIFINGELDDLKQALQQGLQVLKKGGRLAVISFHSLEDRIVKQFMQREARGDDYPEDLPVTADQLNPQLKIVGKKIRASQAELDSNPRSRSAILRVAEKIA